MGATAEEVSMQHSDDMPNSSDDRDVDGGPVPNRRSVLLGGLGLAAVGLLAPLANTQAATAASSNSEGTGEMPTIKTKDGTEIFYKDWGTGQPIVFHHGWPLSADDWDSQMLYFLDKGYRVIAHDRRGHGRSTQTVTGNEMDTYADDVAALVEALDLKDAIHVGHSTGGVEP